ncbi:MAG: tRNA (adenosine(37)-N6)-threonylcarbamoyltransferase complex dimerization subunit type 1 TsaB [Desulfomonilaceae bacterium]
MLILAAHTATSRLGIAVTKNGQIISEEILPSSREHLENIISAIEKVVFDADIELDNIEGLGIAIGPGSFSGIRVGLSVFKGLAMALNVDVAGISTLEILTWQAVDTGSLAIPLIDAGRGEVYTGIFKKLTNNVEIIQAPRLLARNEIASFVSANYRTQITLCGTQDLLDMVDKKIISPRKMITTASPGVCGILAEPRLNNGLHDNIHKLIPLYIRRSDAEEKQHTNSFF